MLNGNSTHSNRDSLIESIHDDFEAAWVKEPFPAISTYVARVPKELASELVADLVLIDLERRWRCAGPSPDSDAIPARPLLENYARVLTQLGSVEELPLALIAAEFRVRHLWGDQPATDEYVRRFPARANEVGSSCQKLMDELSREPSSALMQRRSDDDQETIISDIAGTADREPPDDCNDTQQSFQTLGTGSRIAHFVLRTKLGEGGCGVVFRAQNMNRPYQDCALKFIRPDRLTAPKVVARFRQEIEALTGLSHSNIVCATDSGIWEGIHFLVMEYIEGRPVNHLISRSKQLAVADACELVRQAALGLQHIHENQRTHRDLKPSNLILTTDCVVKILDLGMARLLDIDDPDERLTSIGEIMGTPDYMAPEQWQDSGRVDIRADIYSLGCTLYCLLSGHAPFASSARDTLALMRAHSQAPIPDVAELRDDVTAQLCEIISRCLAKNPQHRFQQPLELAEALQGPAASACLSALLKHGEEHDPPDGKRDSITHLTATASRLDGHQSNLETFDQARTTGTTDSTGQPQQTPAERTGSGVPVPEAEPLADPYAVETIVERPASTYPLGFEETLIERQAELEATYGEETLKPKSSPAKQTSPKSQKSAGSATRQTLGSYSTVGSVVVRQRDVTFGHIAGDSTAEYKIGRKLGEGGMGTVFQARQGSVDRTVALKMVKGRNIPLDAQEKFLAEAVLTGALEHPNIVPIYDLGVNADGELFYAMKEVRGAPWRKTIDEATEDENLDTLIKVADAIAFAHSRGVVHRDLKPDNVMIGEFGEVLVMDWGLALPTDAFEKPGIAVTHGPAGTPSYMAPEMTGRSPELLGPCSDVYLLGALLFRCVTGKPPHSGRHAFAALQAAADNVIDWPQDSKANTDLLSIARRAMKTNPRDRYDSVQEFQSALRAYRTHSESRRLTESATAELEAAEESADYRGYERAIAALDEALNLWPENERARAVRQQARLSYGQAAFNRGDLELAETQLDSNDAQHATLLDQVRQARSLRDTQLRRVRRLKQTAAALAAAIFLTVSLATVLINRARQQELNAKGEAVERFRESQAAISELTELADALRDYPLAQAEREQLLEAVTRYYERQTSELSDVPALWHEQLHSLVQLGRIQNQLAKYQEAIATWDRIDDLSAGILTSGVFQEASERSDSDIEHVELLRGQSAIGRSKSLSVLSQHSRAIEAARRAVASLSDRTSETAPQAVRLELALAQLQMAQALHQAAESDQAESVARQAVSRFEQLDGPEAAVGRAAAESLLARIQERESRYEQAAGSVARAIAIWERMVAAHPSRVQYVDGRATSQIDRANILRAAGRDPLSDYATTVDSFQQLVELRPGIPRFRFNLGAALTGLAWTQNRMCLTTEAQDSAVQAVNAFLFLHERYPQDTRFPLGEVTARIVLAEILRNRGEFNLAVDIIAEAHRVLTEELSADLSDVRERGAEAMLLFGQLQSSLGERDAAIQSMREAISVLQALANSPTGLTRQRDTAAWSLFYLAQTFADSGDSESARASIEEALQIRRQLPERANWLESHAWLLLQSPVSALRDALAARQYAEEAVSLADRNPRFLRTRALAELRQDDVGAAAETLQASRELLQNPHPEQRFLEALLAARQQRESDAGELFDEAARLMDETAPADPRLLLIRRETERAVRPDSQPSEALPDMPTDEAN
jgi:serine/threonine protein kinase